MKGTGPTPDASRPTSAGGQISSNQPILPHGAGSVPQKSDEPSPAGPSVQQVVSEPGATTPVENQQLSPQQQADQKTYPLDDSAIKRGEASSAQLFETYFFGSGPPKHFERDKVNRQVNDRYFRDILPAFEKAHGGIVKSLFCREFVGAVVLTNKDEIHTVLNNIDGADLTLFNELDAQCQRMVAEGRRLLSKRDERDVYIDWIYNVLSQMFGYLDTKSAWVAKANSHDTEAAKKAKDTLQGFSALDKVSLDSFNKQLAGAQAFLEQTAQRHAQIRYFIGMLIGLGALVALVALVAAVARFAGLDAPVAISSVFALSLFAGSVGALVSVMSRMTSNDLVLRYEVGDRLIMLLGGFRPFIGSIFGAALFFLLSSGILPIVVPIEVAKLPYFFGIIAFLAGFSERWAQDMLAITQDRIGESAKSVDKS